MGQHRDLGERLVAASAPRFKNFRIDFEKVSNAAPRLRDTGEVSPESATELFFDADWDLRLPLQRRYAEAGAWDEITRYHVNRFTRQLGRDAPWPDEPAMATLELFVEGGEGRRGVALVRTYVETQLARLRRDFSKRNPRGPRRSDSEDLKRVIGAIDQVIAGAIPDRKRELLRALDAVQPYVDAHGDAEDQQWLAAVRREVWMERRA